MLLTSGDSLIGRDPELEQLRGLVRAVRDGAAVTVWIEGEAGIGKTRLLESLLDAAREQHVAVSHGAAHPLEHTRPFGPLIDALDLRPGSSDPRRGAIGQLLTGQDAPPPGSGPAAGQLQFRAVEDIIDLIELLTDQGPVLLALDDLHWADSSTLLAVRWIARRLTAAPLLLAATLRPSPQSPDLAQLLDDAAQLGSERIELKPLGGEQVDALVRAELGVPAGEALTGVVGRAAGNPLWVIELLRALATEGLLDLTGPCAEVLSGNLPDSIRQLVARRLAYLPERTVAALRTASLLGEAFSLTDMATVTGRRVIDLVDDLGPAFEARLVADHRGVLVFRHQLVRDAIYEQVPEAARVALHREAAQALADTGAPLSKVAGHLVLGALAPDPEAAHSLRLAAEQAAPRAPGVAVELLHRAEELLPPDDPGRDTVLATLVENLLRIGQISRGAAIAEEVLGRPHAAEIDQRLRFTLIDALSILNRGPELIAQTEAAIRESPRMPPSAQAFLLAQSSFGRAFSGDLTGAEAASLQALEYAERSEDVAMITWSLMTLSVAVKTQGRYQDAVAATDRVRELAFESPDPQARMRGPFFMSGMALCDADRFDEAADAFRRAAEECRALETWWLLPDINLVAAEVRLLRGDWEQAALEIEGGIEFAREQGNLITLPRFHGYLALIAAARGDTAAGQRALAPVADELTSEHPRFGAEFVFHAAATLAEVAGRPRVALDHLRRFWQQAAARENRYGHRFVAPTLTRLALQHDDTALAREVADAAEQAAALAGDVPSVHSAALRCGGLIGGDPGRMLQAVELSRRSERVLEHAGACEDGATVLAAGGSAADARRLIEEAIDLYDGLGASWFAARATARLRELGGHRGARGPRQRAVSGWESLTRSERAVAELVAEGMTNREVGQRLFISPHTVNSHLRHTFRKLDVSTRAALAAKVGEARMA